MQCFKILDNLTILVGKLKFKALSSISTFSPGQHQPRLPTVRAQVLPEQGRREGHRILRVLQDARLLQDDGRDHAGVTIW